ncbi:MAG: CDP-alcohol phosphatidyltransferase family protein [candidate division Zixibacteria bacterium]|nr:CDP-alcohol phosphatidyltransferase family protein [candidate division Zixibacteria bacterium]
MKELLQLPNLVSLLRVFLTPIIGYYLWLGDDRATLVCVVLLIIAGITDGLDGYLARRMNKITPLGTALDPVADKIFAGVLVVLLIMFRDLPFWLVAIIIGRDLLILLAGMILLKKRRITLPSNLTGKYTFAVIACLLGSYVIRFDFGMTLFTWLTVLFTVLSLINYSRVFRLVRKNLPAPTFADKPIYRVGRIFITVGLSVVTLIYLYLEYLK